MSELMCAATNLCALLAQKSMTGTLTEFEAQLYEATARYSTTALRFADVTMQSTLLEEEGRLDALRDIDITGN